MEVLEAQKRNEWRCSRHKRGTNGDGAVGHIFFLVFFLVRPKKNEEAVEAGFTYMISGVVYGPSGPGPAALLLPKIYIYVYLSSSWYLLSPEYHLRPTSLLISFVNSKYRFFKNYTS